MVSLPNLKTQLSVCRKRRLKGGLECKLMLMFCVGIVQTNLYNCIS